MQFKVIEKKSSANLSHTKPYITPLSYEVNGAEFGNTYVKQSFEVLAMDEWKNMHMQLPT